MKIIIQKGKVKCDMGKCANAARYSIAPDGVSPSGYLNLCEECALRMRSALNKIKERCAGIATEGRNGRGDI